MRLVGNRTQGSNAAPASPQDAWQRGRVLDAMLPSTLRHTKGVSRMTHAQRNAQDDARMLEIARALNGPA
jgi:hypothetical protein